MGLPALSHPEVSFKFVREGKLQYVTPGDGKLRSAEVLLCEDGSHRLIRRAETPRVYFATLDFLPAMKPLFEGYDD